MTAAAASSDTPLDAEREGTAERLWRPLATFVVYIFTAGLYGIWWFFVSRREMARELGRAPSAAMAVLEGVLHLVPLINAYVWYRVLSDINTLRAKVGAPAVNVWGWVAALALPIPCVYVLPELLGPLLDAFNNDMRGIVRALGYGTLPALVLVFGYAVGYYNEYWLEKTGERATNRRRSPVDWIFYAVAAAAIVGLVVTIVGAA